MTPTELIQVAEWLRDGKLQARSSIHSEYWEDCVGDIHSGHLFDCYRRKPEPRLRPFKPEEVPVGALVRFKTRGQDENRAMICAVSGGCITLGFRGVCDLPVQKNFAGALADLDLSIDGGKTWKPCGVEETV